MPFLLFLAHFGHNLAIGNAADSLWICNISVLTLGVGMALDHPLLMRVSILHLIAGTPSWIVQEVLHPERELTSWASHLGGLFCAINVFFVVGSDRRAWPWALGWYVLLQQLCRVLTPPRLNVNLAFDGFQGNLLFFSSYRTFWLGGMLYYASVIGFTHVVLAWLSPPREPAVAA